MRLRYQLLLASPVVLAILALAGVVVYFISTLAPWYVWAILGAFVLGFMLGAGPAEEDWDDDA